MTKDRAVASRLGRERKARADVERECDRLVAELSALRHRLGGAADTDDGLADVLRDGAGWNPGTYPGESAHTAP
jgi:hypothetical protein